MRAFDPRSLARDHAPSLDRRQLLLVFGIAVLAAGWIFGIVSWQSVYVAAVVGSMVIFGWGLLPVAAAWAAWLPLAVAEELRGGDAGAHSLILLTALLWSMSRRELGQMLRMGLAEGGGIRVVLRRLRRSFAPAEAVGAAVGTLVVGGLRAGRRRGEQHPTALRWAATVPVFAVVFIVGGDALVALASGALALAVAFGMGRAAVVGASFWVALVLWGDPMWSLSAATMVAVLIFGLSGRAAVGVGFGFLVLAGVLVVIERPGVIDRPRLANHAASAAYLFLSLGVARLVYEETGIARLYEETGIARHLAALIELLGRRPDDAAGTASGAGEQAADRAAT